ncbi:addiction module antidote protein [Parasphingopyxis marina]|uniref:Putative addiction module antidote protein n=1 Tax=Parasphingopyxis marina TaxID=2761622 RepID=A0A842HUI4_9SPHN|nr:addiction module antidote protein [Parasphingopyxis marina]MBC2776595.1 putative addiction module antidote protein [Parasphingopyxis marina]
MPLATKPFDAARYLDGPEDYAELLDDALATGHRGYIAAALGTIARAYGVDRLAADTGLNRATLYAAFRDDGNPTLDTVLRVLAQVKVGLGAKRAA